MLLDDYAISLNAGGKRSYWHLPIADYRDAFGASWEIVTGRKNPKRGHAGTMVHQPREGAGFASGSEISNPAHALLLPAESQFRGRNKAFEHHPESNGRIECNSQHSKLPQTGSKPAKSLLSSPNPAKRSGYSASGHMTSKKDRLENEQEEIFRSGHQKLDAAREKRKMKRQQQMATPLSNAIILIHSVPGYWDGSHPQYNDRTAS